MNENSQNLLKLVSENPNLEIITMVEREIIGDDTYGRWYSTIGISFVKEYVMYTLNGDWPQPVYKEDVNEIKESLYDYNDNITDKEVEEIIENLVWVKAIFLNIDLPE